MRNPNDALAPFYDLVYYESIDKDRTKEEINFVRKHIKRGKILDIGCGTGRHMIPLLKRGYDVTGIDASNGMLNVLRAKLKKNHLEAPVINQDIKKFESKGLFDGIIGFWNPINEIVFNEKDAIKLFKSLGKLLVKDGIVIMDVSRPPKKLFPYTREIKRNGWAYKLTYILLSLDKNNISKDKELLEITKNGKRFKTLKARYTHKWWTPKELTKIFMRARFSSVKTYNIEERRSSAIQRTLIIAKR
jgi:2-polyprenyl-3-methyl-5-hydroxy-6-metoxy-1,4-benzoquinol methylase